MTNRAVLLQEIETLPANCIGDEAWAQQS